MEPTAIHLTIQLPYQFNPPILCSNAAAHLALVRRQLTIPSNENHRKLTPKQRNNENNAKGREQ